VKVKIKITIRSGKVLASGTKMFQLGCAQGVQAPNLNLGLPIISESTGARKLKLKMRLDMI